MQMQKQNKTACLKQNNNKQKEAVHFERKVVQSRGYAGPIPPPELMDGYAQVDPSFPDRILRLTEENLKHQYSHQNKMDILQFCGWGSATAITLTAMGLGTYLLMNDKNVAGFCFLIGSALPSIVVFFANKSKKL